MEFHELRLPNGLQLVAERLPSVYSVASGFFVKTGARDETDEVSGVSHFLEHMAFKGTDRFSAADVNRILDEVGAKSNASTGEETTLFYAAVLPEYLPKTLDLLADIIYPSLRQADFDTEKQVILEEIGMYEDQPSYTVYERLIQTHFAGHPLGRSVLGTTESITALTAEQMRAYHRGRYTAGNIVLAVAGKFDWDELRTLVTERCGGFPSGSQARTLTEHRPHGETIVLRKSKIQQQHVMHMMPGPSARSSHRFAAEILSVIVGDDSGSRLFWAIVNPGYAETAELGYSEYEGAGAYLTYYSGDPEEAEANRERIEAVYRDVNRNGVTAEELRQAKNKISSRVVLRSERPMGRLSSLGHNWLYRGEYRSVSDDLATIENLSLKDIRDLLEQYPLGLLTTVATGPLDKFAGTAARDA